MKKLVQRGIAWHARHSQPTIIDSSGLGIRFVIVAGQQSPGLMAGDTWLLPVWFLFFPGTDIYQCDLNFWRSSLLVDSSAALTALTDATTTV